MEMYTYNYTWMYKITVVWESIISISTSMENLNYKFDNIESYIKHILLNVYLDSCI